MLDLFLAIYVAYFPLFIGPSATNVCFFSWSQTVQSVLHIQLKFDFANKFPCIAHYFVSVSKLVGNV